MLDERGYEIPDNTPVELPTRLRVSPNRISQMRQLVRAELSRAAAEQGHETFEEADDFSLPDGEEWVSPYEETFEPPIIESQGGEPEGGAQPPGDVAQRSEGAQPPAKPVEGQQNGPQQPA